MTAPKIECRNCSTSSHKKYVSFVSLIAVARAQDFAIKTFKQTKLKSFHAQTINHKP